MCNLILGGPGAFFALMAVLFPSFRATKKQRSLTCCKFLGVVSRLLSQLSILFIVLSVPTERTKELCAWDAFFTGNVADILGALRKLNAV